MFHANAFLLYVFGLPGGISCSAAVDGCDCAASSAIRGDLFCYQSGSVYYRDAMIALSGGYGAAAAVMLSAVVMGEGLNGPWMASRVLWRDIRSVYNYGAALMPWMLGMLLMLSVDRFSVGYLGLSGGESYLSMKDLFVGVGGLVSMPLLMLVHPLIMKRFREGAFDGALIHSSIGFLIIVFTLLWAVIEFVGFAVFEYFTGKPIVAPMGVLIIAYLGVFFFELCSRLCSEAA